VGHLYAADMRGLIQVWNSTTWHLDDTLDRGYQPFLLRRLVVTPDGRKAFFSGRDLPVTLWDRVTRQVTRLVNYTATHEADTAGHILLGLDISRDGSRLAAYGSYKLLTDVGAQVLYDGALELWSVDDGRPVHTFQLATGHFPFQGTISFSADISTLAVGAQSYVIWYYDTETGEIFHNGPVGLLMESLCYSRDGSMIAAVGYTNGVRLFDPVSDTLIVRLDDDSTDNACVAISPDNRRVVAGDFSGAVRIWARADASSVERAARADGAVSLDCRRDGSSIVVDYVLPRAGDVRIVLCDLLGREVMAVDEGTVGEGHHVSRLDVAGVPSGPYLCALRTGRESVARRVSIVH
jgi:WD40 repeat protein